MASRKSSNFLPGVFQTDTNKKFLNATIDQLISEPNLKKINGYIGRKFAPTFKPNDSYIIEDSADRQNYQLEPTVVVRDEQGEITFVATYIDFLNKIGYYGGFIDNHDRLFENEYYTFNPGISYDKFVNFSQYYWLPNGPTPVDVNTAGVELTKDYTVTRDTANGRYNFNDGQATNNTILLARGGTYTFTVNQPGAQFWIQSELGLDGLLNATPTIGSRDVLGVTNNGTDVGTIIFDVPQRSAQDRFANMDLVASVDYAAPLAYSDLHNNLLSVFLKNYPQYAGITGQLNGKTLVFVDQDQLTSRGESVWTSPNTTDANGNIISTDAAGEVVPKEIRFDVWQVLYIDSGIPGDPLIRLTNVQSVDINQKVFIKYGLVNANREFFKDFDSFYKRMPLLSALQDELYFQDGISNRLFGTFKIVDASNLVIDVEKDILGKANYTSPNGVEFTSGLKIKFDTDVVPEKYQEKEWYVENVGDSIRLVDPAWLVTPEPYNDELRVNFPDQVFPEYITIKRDALDVNAWSRNNRWFHIDIITLTAKYNNALPVFDQNARAQRPIVQFEGDYQLFNNGRIGKQPIDILDTNTIDAFNQFEGYVIGSGEITYGDVFQPNAPQPVLFNGVEFGNTSTIRIIDTTAWGGVTIVDGLRVLFAADRDPLVRDKIYVVNLVQYDADPVTGLPIGPFYIKLNIAEDGDSEVWDTVVVANGQYKGSQWWYDGTQWLESQQKTHSQQDPLFNVYDRTGTSLSEFPRSDFIGTRIFGYSRSAIGASDRVLGFPLQYRNFGTQGDIEFKNYFDNDTFTYVEDQTVFADTKISEKGFIGKIVDRHTVVPRNIWSTAVETTHQYQTISYVYDGNNNPYRLDILPSEQATVPYIKVYKNNTFIERTKFILDGFELTVHDTLALGDKIDVLIYSTDEISSQGYYEIPSNLNLNAQNIDLDTLTLGQIRNHLVALSHNSTALNGNVLGLSNLRDIELKQQGGSILQHSATTPYATLFLLDETANYVNSLQLAQLEYSKFKNKFLELSTTLQGIDPTNPVASVDLILTTINAIKNKTFPWFYSDMVPYGTLVLNVQYTIFNPLVRTYELNQVFNDRELSNLAVLVYLNGVQLVKDVDYTFDTDRPAVTLTDLVTIEIDDVLKFVEYQNTDGNYIPETPTKLGLYPKFVPEIYLDDTYRNPVEVIRGHDGSVTPCFGDYRDDFLLELEKRIYNNIKVSAPELEQELYAVRAGKFRTGGYRRSELNQLLAKSFQSWIGNNRLDFSSNTTFLSNDAFTWNYSNSIDQFDGEQLPGSWRSCYLYFYDTVRPHQTPWEMLGFSIKPSWWEDYYGPAPYTGGNRLLWEDLEAGRIVDGDRAGIDTKFARPGLTSFIPVDVNGYLRSPNSLLTGASSGKNMASAWAVGDIGPTEWAWRTSSDFPFALQRAMALAKPAKYFSLFANTLRYRFDSEVGQYLTNKNQHIKQNEIRFNGEVIDGQIQRTAGYINWISDYLVNQGINPATKITPMLANYEVALSYKLAGYTDKRYIRVLAEQSSPTSTNDSVVIPDEDYEVHLYKSTPVNKITYSGVIVEKTTNGYSVRGYNVNDPFFTIIPSVVNSNAYKITVLNSEGVIYRNYQNLKLTVPYGYEFKSQQQIVDFLISYERFLIAQGFVFNERDDELGETRNFKLSVKEFLFWAQQGWKTGSILVLSPVVNTVTSITVGVITDQVTDSQYGSKVVDQNFKIVKNNNYNIMRTASDFKLTLVDPASVVGFVELTLVQYEHVLVFNNTTVFNDIIYKPELGNRQFRLKLVGQKTAEWDGSLYAPGFIYNSGVVQEWLSGKDYLKGELATYKNQFYVALQNIIATEEFQFNLWKQIDRSEIKTGLLPNFSTTAVKSQSSYDSYGYFQDEEQLRYSHGLIGYKPRQYLEDLGLSDTTQIELYKGYIKQKGTANAVNQLIGSQFNNVGSDISFFEEWAVRVGEYGAIQVNPYVEIALDEKEFSVNPAVARFVDATNSNDGNGLSVFNKAQLYRSTDQYNGKIAIDRTDASNFVNDIPTAGYVNIDDVDATIFDLADYLTLNELNVEEIGSGYTIWCANDFTGNWNVYRITETNNQIVSVSNSLNNFITFTSRTPHGLAANDIFLLRQFDIAFDGFYRVVSTPDLNSLLVEFNGTAEVYSQLTEFESVGILHRLDSLRFTFMENAREYTPPHGWKEGEKIWIDLDAPTSLVQGQPVETGNNLWKVYEKTMPWKLKQDLAKGGSEYVANDGFGTSVRMSADTLLAVVGSPNSVTPSGLTGAVNTFDKNKDDEFEQGLTLIPDAANTVSYGQTVDLAFETAGVGAPDSINGVGLVYVYNRPTGTTAFVRSQVLVGNVATAGRFGSSIGFDEQGLWLYVSAPDEDRVYVYGLNKNVTTAQQISSVNDETIITLNAPISANVGDIIGQFATGANVTILEVVSNAQYKVSSLTNIISGTGYGNITLVTDTDPYTAEEQLGVFISSTVSNSVTSNIAITDFTPSVTNSADSILVTSYNRTFIPEVDYILDGNIIKFITNGNALTPYYLLQGEYSIQQKPYYAFVTAINCPNGAGKEFGYAIDASFDGAQLAVGTPNDTVNVGVYSSTISGVTETFKRSIPIGVATNTVPYKGTQATLVSYREYEGAGSVYVYDRVIEAFNSTGESDYVTTGSIGLVRRVVIDDAEISLGQYTIIGNNTVRFITPPEVGKIVFVETNEFNLLEKLIGVDSLEGGLDAIQNNARFGTSLTICSNNCAIYVGAPNYDNGSVYNTGAVWKFHNKGRLYGINTGQATNPEFKPGDTIRLDNFEVRVNLGLSGNVTVSAGDYITQPSTGANVRVLESTVGNYIKISDFLNSNVFTIGSGNIRINGSNRSVFPRLSSLDEFIGDINDANLLGISALNLNGVLRIITDKTVAKNLLRILSGRNVTGNENGVSNVYDAAGLIVFAFMQIIVTPYNNSGEHFGDKVILAANAYMLVISSERGTTRNYTTFDDGGTVFDDRSTGIFDSIVGAGSVYIYELYDDPRDAVEDPGRYAFAQQLNPGDLNLGDQFGYAIDIVEGYILATAPSDDTTLTDAGTVYLFNNPAGTRGWSLIRYQEPKVNLETINRMYLYSNLTNTILTNMEFIDPGKGKILGIAEQEITYKTAYDPAYYNRGTGVTTNVSEGLFWNTNQVGQVWWNLSRVRFIDYEQGSLTYRSINWGRLFPGSTVEVCEWVESTVLPSDYVAAGFDGEPKYADNSAYVEIVSADAVTNIIGSRYYFWVVNKSSIPENTPSRTLPIVAVQDIIENPKSQGLAYAAVIRNDALIAYNVSQYLAAQNTILHIDYEIVETDNIIHSEYELLQAGSADNFIPFKIVNKLIDSLAGLDNKGSLVPDPNLSVADQYGIGIRPRQSMFVNRLEALNNLIDYVNSVLTKKPVARQYDLTQLSASEPVPLSKEQSQELGEYDKTIEVDTDLPYVNTVGLPVGYRILVENATSQDGLWVIYELQADRTWEVARVQSYKNDLYWEYVDWYAEGFDASEQIEFVVDTLVESLKLPAAPGDEILVRVADGGNGKWNLITVLDNGEFRVVGIQDGTVQLKTSLSDYANNLLGFGNQGYDSNRYDQNPNIEIRNIITALKDDIFINELQGEFNRLFFVMVNYIFNEQKFVDWIFKTSFISVLHQLRSLNQYPNYVKDNQTYYEDYINEVKPYATKIREYNINYDGNDEFAGSVLDFDLAPYYDQARDTFRSPSGELAQIDQQLWATGFLGDKLINPAYPYWYANRNHTVTSILIQNPGRGYVSEPIVSIIGGGNAVTEVATARAVIDFDTGMIIDIILTSPGNGYSLTPTVEINGSSTEPAIAYAVLENQQIRTFDTSLKFDRTCYSSQVKEWEANTVYEQTQYDSQGKWISGDVVTHTMRDNGNLIRKAYSVNNTVTTGNSFNPADFTVFDPANFATANDRTLAYYQPSNSMIARDLKQLFYGIAYPGVEVYGLPYEYQPGMSGEITANITFTNPITATLGTVITQPEADILLNFNLPITASVGQFITQTYINGANIEVTANATVYGNENTSGTPGNVVESKTVYLIKNNNIDFVPNGNIRINGNLQVVSTWGNVYTDPETGITSNVAPYNWSNVGVYPIATTIGNVTETMIEIPDAAITVTKIWSTTKVQGRITSTTDFVTTPISSITQGNIKIGNVWVNSQPTAIDFVSSGVSPFDITSFDNVEYDEDGVPQLGDGAVDTIIRSNYTDASLGLRPEDINVDGGAYVDTYSSHAPEELVPGITFDTLDMKVYTKINDGADVLGYRIFTNMLRETTFLRIADNYTTTLTSALDLADLEIQVADAEKLPTPSPTNGIPGVVFINGERITYYRNYATEATSWIANVSYSADTVLSYSGNTYISVSTLSTQFDLGNLEQHTGNVRQLPSANILGQIRRGTQGTPIMVVHPAGSVVVDGSIEQLIPNSQFSNTTFETDTVVQATTTPSFNLRLSSAVRANVGDVITQATTNTSATVVGTNRDSDIVLITYNDFNRFAFANAAILLSGNVTVNVGDYLTQSTSNANLRVVSATTGANILAVYTTLDALNSVGGNVFVNGVDTSTQLRTAGISVNQLANIAINGTYTSNALVYNDAVYPLIDSLAGKINISGQVTIEANTNLTTANVWYESGAFSAANGIGFEGTDTEQVLFLKQATATNTVVAIIPDVLTTEDTLNTLITEDGKQILEE